MNLRPQPPSSTGGLWKGCSDVSRWYQLSNVCVKTKWSDAIPGDPSKGQVVLSLLLFVAKLCLILCDPLDCRPPCCSVQGISQARILERTVTSFSGEPS